VNKKYKIRLYQLIKLFATFKKKKKGQVNDCPYMMPPAARNLFAKRFLDFQKLLFNFTIQR